MSQDNATYLLNAIDPALKNGTKLKGDDKNITVYETDENTVVTTLGNFRALNDLSETDDFGFVARQTNTQPVELNNIGFTSSDDTVIITNPQGIAAAPSFVVRPLQNIQKIKTSYQNGTDEEAVEITMPSRSCLNFIGEGGITVSTAKSSSEEAYDLAISSVEVQGYKDLTATLTTGSSDTMTFSETVTGSVADIEYGSSFAAVPTTAGILTNQTGTGVEPVVPTPYVKSLTINNSTSAENIFTLTCEPMGLGVISPPKSEVALTLGFNTSTATNGSTIGWDDAEGKAIWQNIVISGINSVTFSIGESFSSILKNPTPSTLTASGSFSFEYETSTMSTNNIYTPRWNNALSKYQWTNFVESFQASANASLSDVLTISNNVITSTGTITISLPTIGANKTIIFNGTSYFWDDFGLGDMTSFGLAGSNRIGITGTSPITTGDAVFGIRIDTSGASTGQSLVAATNTLSFGDPTTYLSQQPYVYTHGYAALGAFANNKYSYQIDFNPGSVADPQKYRAFAWGATRNVSHLPATGPVVAQINNALQSGNVRLDIWTQQVSPNNQGKYIQYIVFRIP